MPLSSSIIVWHVHGMYYRAGSGIRNADETVFETRSCAEEVIYCTVTESVCVGKDRV